jgi:hypothetical protein
MRLLLLLSLLLAGCSLFKKPEDKAPVVVESKPTTVDNYADANDTAAAKASAAVQVAKETLAEGKVNATDKELSVAQANLPRPSTQDLTEARTRATKLDDTAYQKAVVQGEELQKDIDDLWTKVEKARAEDKAKADAELTKLKLQFEEERRSKMMMMFGGAGVAVCLLGVLLIAFSSNKMSGGLLFISGVALGSMSVIWDSPYFVPVFGGVVVLIAIVMGLVLWSRYRGQVQPPEMPPAQS